MDSIGLEASCVLVSLRLKFTEKVWTYDREQ